MFQIYLNFPGTAEKQSQRRRPEMAEAPLTLLWGRHLSTASKSATSSRGRHSCQQYRFEPLGCFQHLLYILKPCPKPTESHWQVRRQSCCRRHSQIPDPRRRGHRDSLSPAALPPSHHHRSHLPPAGLQLPKNGVTNASWGAEASQHPVHVPDSARYAIRPQHPAKKRGYSTGTCPKPQQHSTA